MNDATLRVSHATFVIFLTILNIPNRRSNLF